MDPRYYGVIEMLFSFGVVLVFGFWQLWSVSKAKKARLERERAQLDTRPPVLRGTAEESKP
jgi:hypothetical protein